MAMVKQTSTMRYTGGKQKASSESKLMPISVQFAFIARLLVDRWTHEKYSHFRSAWPLEGIKGSTIKISRT